MEEKFTNNFLFLKDVFLTVASRSKYPQILWSEFIRFCQNAYLLSHSDEIIGELAIIFSTVTGQNISMSELEADSRMRALTLESDRRKYRAEKELYNLKHSIKGLNRCLFFEMIVHLSILKYRKDTSISI